MYREICSCVEDKLKEPTMMAERRPERMIDGQPWDCDEVKAPTASGVMRLKKRKKYDAHKVQTTVSWTETVISKR